MTAMTEFKEKIKAGEFLDALTLAMGEAVELEITTWVSSQDDLDSGDYPAASQTKRDKYSTDRPQANNCLRTRINLIDGEIENEIGREFIDNPGYAELQQLHLEQVQQSRDTLIRNLESLQAMFTIFNNTFTPTTNSLPQQLPAGTRSALSPANE